MSTAVQTPEQAKSTVATQPNTPTILSGTSQTNPPKPTWRVLLVSSDPAWVIQTQTELVRVEPTWSCQHAVSSLNALTLLSALSFNALVMDGTLPDGVSLLC